MIDAVIADLAADFRIEIGREPDRLERWWLRRQVLRYFASGMSAGTAETPQEAQGEARQRDPKGDAQ